MVFEKNVPWCKTPATFGIGELVDPLVYFTLQLTTTKLYIKIKKIHLRSALVDPNSSVNTIFHFVGKRIIDFFKCNLEASRLRVSDSYGWMSVLVRQVMIIS